MKVDEFYATESQYLKAADLGGRKHKLTIESVQVVEFKDKSRKAAIKFKGRQKGLVLNKTNAQLIGKQHGQDMEGWGGKDIIIYPTTTDFGGEMVDCIRVEQVIPEAAPDDDIPF